MGCASVATVGVSAFKQLNPPVDCSSSSTFGSRVTSVFLKRRNAPLYCVQRALSITRSVVIDDNEDVDMAWDLYLGEVTANEKVEKPPLYVPPPPIPAEDISIRDKLESLLYSLKRILPGQLDNDKAEDLCSMLSATVEVQNPAVCFRGSSRFSEWLDAFMQMQVSVNLHELYYENDMKNSENRSVYAVWTVSFLEHAHTSPTDVIDSLSAPELTQLSGETVFEMEISGLVSRISSTWYILQEDDGASFTKARDSLWRLLGETF